MRVARPAATAAPLPPFVLMTVVGLLTVVAAQPPLRQPPSISAPAAVRPIEPPSTPLPAEAASASETRFSFIAYGDTRGQADGAELQRNHSEIVDAMVAKVEALRSTPFPVRFAVQSGDAVVNGRIASQWNTSFTPLIDKLTRGAGIPYFFAVGNHDVSTMPVDDVSRTAGLRNTLAAISKLIPADGSPRRLNGYPTYAFGYGNVFVIALDSNIALDGSQFSWTKNQLEHLDRGRYHHVIAVFHHPPFSSGPHGGSTIEPQTAAIRAQYMPLFRAHHVRMTITGHDHLLDHWVETYVDNGRTFRRDDVVTGGGGAPTYTYSGEPDLRDYLAAGARSNVRVEHLARPGRSVEDNPHHFLVIEVDADRLSLEVVTPAASKYAPYNGRSRIDLSS
jgi:acid phosphatase type 7